MEHFWKIVISCLIFRDISAEEGVLYSSLPKNLSIGAGSSAYQVEGAWNASDKSESIWDRRLHTTPTATDDGTNGDITCNMYYKYKEDVQLMKSIGLDSFRFSISWSRILPTGFTNVISKDGLQYYKNLTMELVANGIEPIVMLYHWDHPQILEEYGGWTNELMVDWFVSFARVIFKELGVHVKTWVTFNEPQDLCTYSYGIVSGMAQIAPAKNLTKHGPYICVHNILKAHAKTYHMYDKEFRETQKGRISIASECATPLPLNSSDTVSPDTAFQFGCGWIGHPIYIGDYADVMKKRIAMISKAEGFEKSRLPEFSEEWITLIKGTADYFALNHYTSIIVAPDPDEELGIYNTDRGLVEHINYSWPTAPGMEWLHVYPPGFSTLLRKIRDDYNNPPVWITENGYSTFEGLEDYSRISYHHDYLEELLIAINRDGCNVIGYSVWSFLDSFEWISGHSAQFGMISVDVNDPDRKRTPKLSSLWWTEVLRTRELQPVPTMTDS